MMKVCFIEMEGLLLASGDYLPDKKRLTKFIEQVSNFCKKEKISLYLLSGFHEKIAMEEFDNSNLKKYFDKSHFLYVDENYISKKAELDEKIHREALDNDSKFIDSYFKQIAIEKVIDETRVAKEEMLLLCNDIWVDGYYTTRFTKINFALFEENILERGNKAERISGLAYFSLEFDSVKKLIVNFPEIDFDPMGKFIFNIMKKVLMSDVDLSGVVKKISKNQAKSGSGLNETKIN